MKSLAVEHLDVRHGQLQAVRDISFKVAPGESLALVGANGAGKTTLLRAIAGAHIPRGGHVLLLDEVSLGLSPLVVDRVYESLAGLMKTGVTLVLVEQDLARAMSVASRIICMLEGRVVLEKPTAELTRDIITDAYFGIGKQAEAAEATP